MIFYILTIFILVIVTDYFLKSPSYKGPISDHFNGRHFKNISTTEKLITKIHEKSGDEITLLTFFIKKLKSKWKKRDLPNGVAKVSNRVFGKDINVTFVNHSTVLIQTEGINFLTDPVWAKRVSPFPFFGTKRYMDPGIEFHNLPEIDFILLSHNHYDHLDISTLKKLTSGGRTKIFTTLGNTAFLNKKGIYNCVDMDWGDLIKFDDSINIKCVPSQHFSSRAISDRDKTLWGGFVVETLHGDIYFAGDTGYGPFIERIKKSYPQGFRLSFLPIGAFSPVSLMKEVHIGPEEMIKMAKEIKTEKVVPIHFGTFDMAFDGQDEPVDKLKEIIKKEKISDIDFYVLINGQQILIK